MVLVLRHRRNGLDYRAGGPGPCYAGYIAVGHGFHDAYKRTAHTSMQLVLALNGMSIQYDAAQMGDKIIAAAQGLIEDDELANYLRSSASSISG